MFIFQFPPDNYSVSYNRKLDGEEVHDVMWIRAKKWMTSPKLVKRGAAKTDVNQGNRKCTHGTCNIYHLMSNI